MIEGTEIELLLFAAADVARAVVNPENTNGLQYVLAHEYVHIRRFDSITKLVLFLPC